MDATGKPTTDSAPLFVRSAVLLLCMLLSALLGQLAIPRLAPLHDDARAQLELVVPKSFGVWTVDKSIVPITPSPDQVALIDEIYDETVSRTYVNDKGERIMLSLAYGRNQSRRFQIHKPEVCYVGQGFQLSNVKLGSVKVKDWNIPVMEMVATQGRRVEPISYWIRVGDELGRGWLEQNRIRAKYALRAEIPDGLLFRISNISRGVYTEDFQLHERFISDLLAGVEKKSLPALLGDTSALIAAPR
jgi:EpsI family protein